MQTWEKKDFGVNVIIMCWIIISIKSGINW